MEIVMGSAYMGWMEDFGLIGVFCSLVVQKSCLQMILLHLFQVSIFQSKSSSILLLLGLFQRRAGSEEVNRLLGPKLKRNYEGEEGEKLKRHGVRVAQTC
jgi:hypothetical protein